MVIVFRSLDTTAATIEHTFHDPSFLRAVIAIPLEAPLHPGDLPLVLAQALDLAARQISVLYAVTDTCPLSFLAPIDAAFEVLRSCALMVAAGMAVTRGQRGAAQAECACGDDGQHVTQRFHLPLPSFMIVKCFSQRPEGLRRLLSAAFVRARAVSDAVVVLRAPDAFACPVERLVQALPLGLGVPAVTAEAPVHPGDLLLIPAQLAELPSAQLATLPTVPDTGSLIGKSTIDAVFETAFSRAAPVGISCMCTVIPVESLIAATRTDARSFGALPIPAGVTVTAGETPLA
jgi:hypothetical protein